MRDLKQLSFTVTIMGRGTAYSFTAAYHNFVELSMVIDALR